MPRTRTIVGLLVVSALAVLGPVVYLKLSSSNTTAELFGILSNLAASVTIIWLALSLFFKQKIGARQMDVIERQLLEMERQSTLLVRQDKQNSVNAFITLYTQGVEVLAQTYNLIVMHAPKEVIEKGSLQKNRELSKWLEEKAHSPSGFFEGGMIELYCKQYEAVQTTANMYQVDKELNALFFEGRELTKNYAILKAIATSLHSNKLKAQTRAEPDEL